MPAIVRDGLGRSSQMSNAVPVESAGFASSDQECVWVGSQKVSAKWPCIPGRTRYGEYSTTLSSSVTPIADVCDYKDSLTVSWNSIDFPGSGFW